MEAKGWMMLRVLINRYNAKAGNSLLKFLPQEEAQRISEQDIRSSDLTPLLFQAHHFIEKIHHSWLRSTLETFPSELRPLVIGSLSQEQAAGLEKSLKIQRLPVSGPVKNFFVHELYTHFSDFNHLPVDYLPEADLNALLKWSKKDLTQLIDFLSLHDLASEIKRIVDKNQLQNLYSCLSERELYYLKICLHQKEQIKTPKLEIDPRQQDCDYLRQVLHRRGLLRLGKALSGQHPDLVWYLAHRLDIGRGRILMEFYAPEALSRITPILKQQVMNLMNFLNKKESV